METKIELSVKSGNHARKFCPVSYKLAKDGAYASAKLTDAAGKSVPAQLIDKGDKYELLFIIGSMAAGKEEIYTLTLSDKPAKLDAKKSVILSETTNGVEITAGGKYFSTFVYGGYAKPFLGPVKSEYDTDFTRLDLNTTEHVHQRSVWFAIGDVEGQDFWNEPENHGKQLHQGFEAMISGAAAGKITTKNEWVTARGTKLMTDTRSITVYNTPAGNRIVDVELNLQSAGRRVVLGATKEAGPLGVRVNESMKVDNGGTMVNSYGSITEKECWGKRAEWCDYYGNVEGKTLGISVFDNSENENFPTYWHIRNYGLFAPNNFYFIGSRILKPDEKITYKYRLYFHTGTTADAVVADRYQDYVNPPTVAAVVKE